MTRRWLLVLVLLGRARLSQATDAFSEKVLEHNESWGKFFRRWFGCKEDETDPVNCKPGLGELSRKLFDAARKTAARLFDFKE